MREPVEFDQGKDRQGQSVACSMGLASSTRGNRLTANVTMTTIDPFTQSSL